MTMSRPRPTALIDFRAPDAAATPLHLAFGVPRERLRAMTPDEVAPLLARVDTLARAGAWCVGCLRSEAAVAFDEAFETHAVDDGRPLAAFDIHDAPMNADDAGHAWRLAAADGFDVQWTGGPRRAPFDATIAEIHRAIADGEVYQVNATAPLTGTMRGDPLALFAALRRAQPNAYAAFLDLDAAHGDAILSVSPELFFDWRGGRLLARPMKGTAPRGATAAEDAANAEHLKASDKERAENLMIVDLLRNDLSRIAEPFSVEAPRLFHTEAWPTVWQMSSDVVARTRAGTTLADVFAALFPCGSITGAPKVQAMRLINALEPEARGVYCGAIGVVQPGGAATFNVPIRTLEWRGDHAQARLRCGIGSGITADAQADAEWDEWRHKRAFLGQGRAAVSSAPMTSFELLETLALVDGALRDAPAHLARMQNAAAHFGYLWNEAAVVACLHRQIDEHPAGTWRIRLLLDAQGLPRAEAFAMDAPPSRVQLQLASRAFDEADSEFSRFKTTRRAHYEAFAPTTPGVFDTLLWNRHGEITECTRGNIALLLDGRWVTPPLRCGLLNGIGRATRLHSGQLAEAVVRVDDLPRVQAFAFLNSLRGWLDADLCKPQK